MCPMWFRASPRQPGSNSAECPKEFVFATGIEAHGPGVSAQTDRAKHVGLPVCSAPEASTQTCRAAAMAV